MSAEWVRGVRAQVQARLEAELGTDGAAWAWVMARDRGAGGWLLGTSPVDAPGPRQISDPQLPLCRAKWGPPRGPWGLGEESPAS